MHAELGLINPETLLLQYFIKWGCMQ